jgi:hypothetical protein
VDDRSVWMLLGREMFQRCESANARRERPAELLVCSLTKHYIAVMGEATHNRVWITRNSGEKEILEAQFRLEIWNERLSLPRLQTLKATEGPLFSIGESARELTVSELCEEILAMLGVGDGV